MNSAMNKEDARAGVEVKQSPPTLMQAIRQLEDVSMKMRGLAEFSEYLNDRLKRINRPTAENEVKDLSITEQENLTIPEMIAQLTVNISDQIERSGASIENSGEMIE